MSGFGRTMRLFAALLVVGVAATTQAQERIETLNAAFLRHLDDLAAAQPREMALARDMWETRYRDARQADYVCDALAVLRPDFRAALSAFDAGRYDDAAQQFTALTTDDDPFVAANAAYFTLRSEAALGDYERVAVEIAPLLSDMDALRRYTAYAPHVQYLAAVSDFRNLMIESAAERLRDLLTAFPDAPEPVAVGARQLLLEIERRQSGPLARVRDLMEYSAVRLGVADGGERVRTRQQTIVDMLSALIEQAEAEEQSQQQAGDSSSGEQEQSTPRQGAQQSTDQTPSGGGDWEQHAGEEAKPGESWGALPPAERERILQQIRERFPSQYRQLVEQYFRVLAEEE